MNHFILGILKIIVLEASAALAVLDRAVGGAFPRARRAGFLGVGALAVLAFLRFGDLRGNGSIVHHWEQFHFYLGAKYQRELGSFDLYKAVLLADREGVHLLDGLTQTRDIRTFDVVPISVALEDGPRVRARFSDERWAAFKEDWRRMSSMPGDWRRVLLDHGNSNSPAWAAIAHPIASLLPLTHGGLVAIAWLDLLLMIAAWAMLFRTFGVKVASPALVIAASAPNVFDYLAGSFLRWDWFFACAMALCFLARRRFATAGAFFGYAVATKLFPLFFGVTLLFRAGREVIRERRVAPRYGRFAAGALASVAVAVAVSTAMFGGLQVWADYKDRIHVAQLEKYYPIQYSLKTVFLQAATTLPAELWRSWAAPPLIHQSLPNVDISQHAVGFLLVQLLFTLFVAAIALRSDEVGAFALGPLLVFVWLTVNMYYWNMLGFVALAFALRKDSSGLQGLLGLHAIWVAFYVYQHTNHGYAEGYFTAVLIAAGLIALGVREGAAWARARRVPAHSSAAMR